MCIRDRVGRDGAVPRDHVTRAGAAAAERGDVDRAAPQVREVRGRPGDVVTGDCAVSPYLLADGHFADRLRETCRDAAAVAGVLGPHPAVVRLVAERAESLRSGRRSA